jgi:hypothetical protein
MEDWVCAPRVMVRHPIMDELDDLALSDMLLNVVAVLRTELAEEAAAGFPRLRRIAQTDFIWFLDYFAGLAAAEREALLDALAQGGAMAFFPRQSAGEQEIAPALARLRERRERPGSKGGTRYMDMKTLCMNPSLRAPGGYHPSWRENLTELHFQPRTDLLPDLSHLKAAKAPLLRKLVNASMTRAFQPKKEKQPGGSCKFVFPYGNGELMVWVHFGSMPAQLIYHVSLKNAASEFLITLLSYESLWGAASGWDYLTEENAERSIDFLAEQIVYLAKLADRVNGRNNGCG